MAHKPHEQICGELKEAKRKIKIGADYVHYKSSSRVYRVIDIGTLEASDELCVIYQLQDGSGLIFVRPLKEWLEPVDWQGKPVQRFKPVKA